MKINKVFDFFDVKTINESNNRNDMKLNYNLDLVVANGGFRARGKGSLRLDQDTYSGIVCVEDIINYIIEEETKHSEHFVKHDGVNSKEILSQMLFSFADDPNVAQSLTTKDSINFSFDYGPVLDSNSIGLMVVKQIGSPSFSLVMRMNQQSLPQQYSKQALDARIVSYTSSV